MAKSKKAKDDGKKKFEYSHELLGIIFLLSAILGAGRFGPVGKLICCFAVFLVGNLYGILLVGILIIGILLLFNKEKLKFFSNRLIGLYILIFVLLTWAHLGYLKVNNGHIVKVFQATLDELVGVFNIVNSSGRGNITNSGGGILGASFASLLYSLFAKEGTIIILIVLIGFGILLLTGFSIVKFIKRVFYRISLKFKKEPKEKEDTVKINDNNNERDNRIVISSLDELTSIKNEKQLEEVSTPKTTSSNSNSNYQLPSLDLLNKPVKGKPAQNNIESYITKLENVLKEFDIIAKVVEVTVGPTYTQYELEVGSGTKLTKIIGMTREISMALAKKDVRIQAPIPGKSTVGIEIANDETTTIYFKEIMETLPKSLEKSKLLVGLGKDIMNNTKYVEIDKTPHLLVAGATGSGKSVCINCMIISILMRTKPDEVKLMLIDPKKVELSMYNGVPHLIRPVVTNPKEAAIALKKIVDEMDHRYNIFEERGVKNIATYNEYIDNKNKTLPPEERIKRMPYIVVIVDELADLMMVASKEVEECILRITQMARAAGIHLVIATQRPSTDVITGLIKANIPSRISFAVSNGIDSRTILDMLGAEKLLGRGDMLFKPLDENTPIRIQGAWITDEEIKRVVDYTISQQKAEYDEKLMNLSAVTNNEERNEIRNNNMEEEEYDDPLYNDIVEFIVKTGKASASLLQRRFKLGYNRAARIIDLLEERGIIGPQNGSKPREVLVKLEGSASNYDDDDDEDYNE